MNKKTLTFIISSRNNLRFLKLCYESIKHLKIKYRIIILDDASTDGTKEWLESLEDHYLTRLYNDTGARLGICGMFDKGVEAADTEYVMILHADMIISPNFDKNILKHVGEKVAVCATRIEPSLHPPGPEKITMDFGFDVDDFKSTELNTEFLKLIKKNKDKTTEGIFAPWCVRKQDYLDIGGHDQLFAPQSREDSDLFNRMSLAGFHFIQSWDALVYHFTCRGSRYNETAGGGVGKDSEEWKFTNNKSMRNFIRKWGRMVEHDQYMKPIVKFKYNIGLVIESAMLSYIEHLEPYFSNIYTNIDVSNYIEREQPLTLYNLQKKFIPFNGKPRTDLNDIVIHCTKPLSIGNEQEVQQLLYVPYILDEIKEPGSYVLFDGCVVYVNCLVGHEYENL